MNLTEEDTRQWEEEIKKQDDFMLAHGWKQVKALSPQWNDEALVWEDPTGTIHPYINGYDQLTLQLLKEKGWRMVKQIQHVGKPARVDRISEWGRFQSPDTKRLYTFLDAQYIMEQGWDESHYPDKCCEATRQLNRLAGDNFTGDVIETWFYREGEQVHQLWDG